MSTPAPTAGASPSAAGPQSDQMAAAIQAFAAAQGGGASSGKRPGTWTSSDTAVESTFGPMSRPLQEAEYQHGTFRSQNYKPPTFFTTKSVGDMTNEYYNWNQDQRDQFRSQLALIDKTALTASDADIAKIWGDYVQQSADYYAAGQTLSPLDILAKDISTKSTGAPSKRTETTSDTTVMSRADSDAIFRAAAQSLLGRNPTEAESAQFAQLLGQQEAANPTQATVTTSYDAQGNVADTSRTTTGGFSSSAAQDLARQVAQQSPDYGANAANNYMNVLLGLVGVK